MKGKSESEVAQSCPTLRDPMVFSLPGSSVHGIFQARVLEWGAIAFSNSVYYSSLKSRVFCCLSIHNVVMQIMFWVPNNLKHCLKSTQANIKILLSLSGTINTGNNETWEHVGGEQKALLVFSEFIYSFQQQKKERSKHCSSAGKESACNAGDLS